MPRTTIVYDWIVTRLQEAREYDSDVLRAYFVVITVIIGHHAAAKCIGYEN